MTFPWLELEEHSCGNHGGAVRQPCNIRPANAANWVIVARIPPGLRSKTKVQERISDADLSKLSVQELTDLQTDIHAAIRAVIRGMNEAKLRGRDAPEKGLLHPSAPPASRNLAEERDAWLASRKR